MIRSKAHRVLAGVCVCEERACKCSATLHLFLEHVDEHDFGSRAAIYYFQILGVQKHAVWSFHGTPTRPSMYALRLARSLVPVAGPQNDYYKYPGSATRYCLIAPTQACHARQGAEPGMGKPFASGRRVYH